MINKKLLIQSLNSNPAGFQTRLFIFVILFQIIISIIYSLIIFQYSKYHQKLFENEIRSLISKYKSENFTENKHGGYIVVNLTESLFDGGFDEIRLKKRQHKVNRFLFILIILFLTFFRRIWMSSNQIRMIIMCSLRLILNYLLVTFRAFFLQIN
jgi:hypothetical protein